MTVTQCNNQELWAIFSQLPGKPVVHNAVWNTLRHQGIHLVQLGCLAGSDLENVPDQWLILEKVVFGDRRVTPLGAILQPAVMFRATAK